MLHEQLLQTSLYMRTASVDALPSMQSGFQI